MLWIVLNYNCTQLAYQDKSMERKQPFVPSQCPDFCVNGASTSLPIFLLPTQSWALVNCRRESQACIMIYASLLWE